MTFGKETETVEFKESTSELKKVINDIKKLLLLT